MDLLDKIDSLRSEIQKEQDELWKMSTVLNSVKVFLNYMKTGEPYADEPI